MLELLIAIGVILVLITIGVVGFRSMVESSSDRQTRLLLTSAEGLLKEMNAIGANQRLEGPPGLSPRAIFEPTTTFPPLPPALSSPGKVTSDQQPNRVALYNARFQKLVMQVLATNPKNKTSIEQMPSQQVLPRPQGVSEADYKPPMLADGWGNPIVFVPSGGLTGINVAGGNNVTITTSGMSRDVVKYPNASQDPATQNRPFWASAGPDGDFTAGDDNIYSFQSK